MTINLHSLINEVRDDLGEVKPDIINDEGIYIEIKKANAFIQLIKDEDYDNEDAERQTILVLASYFTYINYTSIMESLSGELGFNSTKKTEFLRQIALMFLRQITTIPLDEDLQIDESKYNIKSLGFMITENVWS